MKTAAAEFLERTLEFANCHRELNWDQCWEETRKVNRELHARMLTEGRTKEQIQLDRLRATRAEFINIALALGANQLFQVLPPWVKAGAGLSPFASEAEILAVFRSAADKITGHNAKVILNALVELIMKKEGLAIDSALEKAKSRYPQIADAAQRLP